MSSMKEKVLAADLVVFYNETYKILGWDSIDQYWELKTDGGHYESISGPEMERYYDNGTLKLYKMVELQKKENEEANDSKDYR